jgi:plastocyanin
VGLLLVAVVLTACGDADRRDRSASAAPPAATAQPARNVGDATTVHVTTEEFSFALDTTNVPAGPVTFVVRNDGQAPHDFRLSGNDVNEKIPIIQAGESKSLTVELKPGTYTYICTVGGHEQMGMKGTLTVS